MICFENMYGDLFQSDISHRTVHNKQASSQHLRELEERNFSVSKKFMV